MSIWRRKVMYLGIMPFIFCINIMINVAWVNTTVVLVLIVIGALLLKISDKGNLFVPINDWIKRNFVELFPDIYQTGVMPTGRFWLVSGPCLASIALNTLIAIYI
ncbi:MAG: hypothetical protein IJC41_05810 [Firmicutes bacterium]|nr:hypothetical protein [Clostridiales bacterium]MBQ4340492.1 hypothetical protein [Bacillota bacterium]